MTSHGIVWMDSELNIGYYLLSMGNYDVMIGVYFFLFRMDDE